MTVKVFFIDTRILFYETCAKHTWIFACKLYSYVLAFDFKRFLFFSLAWLWLSGPSYVELLIRRQPTPVSPQAHASHHGGSAAPSQEEQLYGNNCNRNWRRAGPRNNGSWWNNCAHPWCQKVFRFLGQTEALVHGWLWYFEITIRRIIANFLLIRICISEFFFTKVTKNLAV